MLSPRLCTTVFISFPPPSPLPSLVQFSITIDLHTNLFIHRCKCTSIYLYLFLGFCAQFPVYVSACTCMFECIYTRTYMCMYVCVYCEYGALSLVQHTSSPIFPFPDCMHVYVHVHVRYMHITCTMYLYLILSECFHPTRILPT